MINKKTHMLPIYKCNQTEFIKGDGCYLYDKNNKKYIDFFSNYAATSLGHNNSIVFNALKEQMDTGIIMTAGNNFYTSNTINLAQRICELTFADMVFFMNSGAEVVELALKIAKKYYHSTRKIDLKPEIITFKNAFHGRTLAMISAANNPKHIDGFAPLVDGYKQAIFNNIESVRNLINESTCGILIELIQGEGGMIEIDKEFIQEIRKLCTEMDIALIIDEVQTGNSRTGYLYAYQKYGIIPDILATAKGIGGGYPLGYCSTIEKYGQYMTSGTHGTTFGGNPMATKIGLAVLNEISKKEFLDNILYLEGHIRNEFIKLQQKCDFIEEIITIGLMCGLRLNEKLKADNIFEKLLLNGLISSTCGRNIIRFLPPLNITKDQIDEGLNIIKNALF